MEDFHAENEGRLNKVDLDLNRLIAKVQRASDTFDKNVAARNKAAGEAKNLMHHLHMDGGGIPFI